MIQNLHIFTVPYSVSTTLSHFNQTSRCYSYWVNWALVQQDLKELSAATELVYFCSLQWLVYWKICYSHGCHENCILAGAMRCWLNHAKLWLSTGVIQWLSDMHIGSLRSTSQLLLKFAPNTLTHTRLTALCLGLPRSAGTRKVKPIWILLKQEKVSGSGISKSAPRTKHKYIFTIKYNLTVHWSYMYDSRRKTSTIITKCCGLW